MMDPMAMTEDDDDDGPNGADGPFPDGEPFGVSDVADYSPTSPGGDVPDLIDDIFGEVPTEDANPDVPPPAPDSDHSGTGRSSSSSDTGSSDSESDSDSKAAPSTPVAAPPPAPSWDRAVFICDPRKVSIEWDSVHPQGFVYKKGTLGERTTRVLGSRRYLGVSSVKSECSVCKKTGKRNCGLLIEGSLVWEEAPFFGNKQSIYIYIYVYV